MKKHTLFLRNGKAVRVTPSELKWAGPGMYFKTAKVYSTVTLLDDGTGPRFVRHTN